ncbi:MAG: hypothetical protein ACE5HO_18070 [bacterium]
MKISSRLTPLMLPFAVLLVFASNSLSQGRERTPFTLAEVVGQDIDVVENERYHLFSRDVGLVLARVYVLRYNVHELHLMGEQNGKPWLLVRDTRGETITKMISRINMVETYGENQASTENLPVIYSIKLSEGLIADNPTKIEFADKTKLYGKITKCSKDTVWFTTLTGLRIAIPDHQIAGVSSPAGQFVGGSFLTYDPNQTRLFFGPTGRTLRQGEVTFSDFYVFFPTLSVGVSDFFMLGGGVSLIPGASSQLVYFAPKARFFHGQNFDMAGGLLYLAVPGEGGVGAAYSALTLGNPLHGLTLGAAMPFSSSDGGSELESAILFVGGEIQLSNTLKLISENWIFTGGDGLAILSGGFRFIGDRLTVDLGFFAAPQLSDGDGFPLLPWLGFSLNFGK